MSKCLQLGKNDLLKSQKCKWAEITVENPNEIFYFAEKWRSVVQSAEVNVVKYLNVKFHICNEKSNHRYNKNN